MPRLAEMHVLKPSPPVRYRCCQIVDKHEAKRKKDKPCSDEGSEDGKDGKPVRGRLEGLIVRESLRRQPDLHGGEDNGDEDGCRRQPTKVVLKKGPVLLPLRDVAAQDRALREHVDLV